MVEIIFSEAFLTHLTGFGHPECPDRLSAIVQYLTASQWAKALTWKTPTPLNQRDPLYWIGQVHDPDYIAQVRSLAARGGGRLDPDTPISPQSFDVACLAVNAWLDGVDSVLSHHRPAFALARPPGHHALPDRGMGFCVFANAAIAALYALAQPGIERVAILDWDVHHGNGTQAIVANHPQIAYCSLHQYPYYPGTGSAQEKSQTLLNIPMAAGSAIADYEAQFQQQVIPFLQTFTPHFLIVSAGFDANRDDPLAEVNLQPEDYGQFTRHCLALTPNILFGLEGGYDLDSLAASVAATIAPCLKAFPEGLSA